MVQHTARRAAAANPRGGVRRGERSQPGWRGIVAAPEDVTCAVAAKSLLTSSYAGAHRVPIAVSMEQSMTIIYLAAALALSSGPAAHPLDDAAPVAVAALAPTQERGRGQGGQDAARGGERTRETQAQEPRGRGRSGDQARGQAQRDPEPRQAQPRGNERSGRQQVQSQGRERATGGQAQRTERVRTTAQPSSERGAAARASGPGERGNSGAAVGRSGSAPGRAATARSGRATAEAARSLRTLSPTVQRMAQSRRRDDRLIAGALAHGTSRGLARDAVTVRRAGDRVQVYNRSNQLLFDLDDRRARALGGWEMRRLGDQRPRGNAPSFCRSGEGHPVWGREWCLDKGFGLGSRSGTIWSRTRIDDIIFGRRTDRDRYDRGGLIDILGDIVVGRLALHALSLGYDRPLVGYWVAEPESPRLMRVYAGDNVVAEFVDWDRDDRVEYLYVVQPVY